MVCALNCPCICFCLTAASMQHKHSTRLYLSLYSNPKPPTVAYLLTFLFVVPPGTCSVVGGRLCWRAAPAAVGGGLRVVCGAHGQYRPGGESRAAEGTGGVAKWYEVGCCIPGDRSWQCSLKGAIIVSTKATSHTALDRLSRAPLASGNEPRRLGYAIA